MAYKGGPSLCSLMETPNSQQHMDQNSSVKALKVAATKEMLHQEKVTFKSIGKFVVFLLTLVFPPNPAQHHVIGRRWCNS